MNRLRRRRRNLFDVPVGIFKRLMKHLTLSGSCEAAYKIHVLDGIALIKRTIIEVGHQSTGVLQEGIEQSLRHPGRVAAGKNLEQLAHFGL
ncbi:MAG: hypothetical protein U5O69_03410 [Candidatus Competibacteraceae bacterium]|nr:hypothetical protein [Candidatus Competibacteraceae bacterium]